MEYSKDPMSPKVHQFSLENKALFIHHALEWATDFSHFTYLTDCNLPYPQSGFREILFVGSGRQFDDPADVFSNLHSFHQTLPCWLTGYFSYDVKNQVEELNSKNPDKLHFSEAYFYQPQYLFLFEGNEVTIHSMGQHPPEQVYNLIKQSKHTDPAAPANEIVLYSRFDKQQYLQTVDRVKTHILNGDIYQMNLCMELFAQPAKLNPLQVFLKLIKISPAPFAVLQKINSQYVIGSSPERFLKKVGSRLISQPMKGTAARHPDPTLDEERKKKLEHSGKDKAENLMITDLVRNDLARSAVPGSTQVTELFGIYSFSHVHQMITTVTCTIDPGITFTEVIKNAFPMGSMTGAPKVKAMELIEKYERTKRGLFSGAIGYITPEADFDFNVVIRTLLYDTASNYLSLQVGSAITLDSDPLAEYEECMLKAVAIKEALEN